MSLTHPSHFVAATSSSSLPSIISVKRAESYAGGQDLASSGQVVGSVAQELDLKSCDILNFNE